nr:MAG: RNA-dependent RNA polymerase [Hangzhou steitz-like virus 7]
MPRRPADQIADRLDESVFVNSDVEEEETQNLCSYSGNQVTIASKTRPKRAVLSFRTIFHRLAKDLEIDPVDRNYAIKRLQQEGVSFLTKTLPLFAKYTLACCEAGTVLDAVSCGLTHFRLRKGAPVFLHGLLTGAVAGSAECLYRIRQLCDYFYKLAFKFTNEVERAAIHRYLDTENAFLQEEINWDTVEEGRKVFLELFPNLASASVPDILRSGPYNGPGAFYGSEGLSMPYELYKKLSGNDVGYGHRVFRPYIGYFRPYPGAKKLRWPALSDAPAGRTAKVVMVPKDSRGPRVISKEDMHLLMGQMAFNKYVSRQAEYESEGRVLFSDQTVHRELARKGSIDGANATLDLKDASDRVRLDVARHVFGNSPGIRWFLKHARSTHAELSERIPRKGGFYIKKYRIRLRKVANMGSGICFPVLALIVYIASVIGVKRYYRSLPLKKCARKVYVFGDDDQVPAAAVDEVIKALEEFGLKVNTDKSFWRGRFRESCGADYYHGVSVVPIRLRLTNGDLGPVGDYRNGFLGFTRSNVGLVLQLERHCRELVEGGLRHLSEYYYDRLERALGSLPLVSRDCPALGRYDPYRVVPSASSEAYFPESIYVQSDLVCPWKGIGKSLSSSDGLGIDWSLTPLRRKLKLKRRVLEPATRVMYGLTHIP